MLTLLLALSACAPPTYVGPEESLPSVRILFPNPDFMTEADAARPVCSTFPVVIGVEDFEIVPAGDAPVPGEGHWHLHVDDPNLEQYLDVGLSNVIDLVTPLEPGPHTLYAALRENTHAPLAEELAGSDIAFSEITVQDTPDCIGNFVEADPDTGAE